MVQEIVFLVAHQAGHDLFDGMMAIGQGRGQVIEITAGFADIDQGLLVALGGVLVIQVIAKIDIRYLFQRAQGQLAFLVAINLHVRPDIDFFLGNLAGGWRDRVLRKSRIACRPASDRAREAWIFCHFPWRKSS